MANVRLSDAIDGFKAYARGAYADGTVRAAASSLNSLLVEVGNIYLHNLTIVHVDRWCSARTAAGISPQSVRNNLTHLKMLSSWARGRRMVPAAWDPIGTRRLAKAPTTQFLRIPAERFPALLDAAPDPLDRIVVALGLYLFLRASEIRTLTIKDVDLDEGWVDVKVWKSGKKDRMPISLELHDELHRWLTTYQRVMGDLEPHWFLVPAREPFGVDRRADGRMLPPTELRLRPLASPSKVHWSVHKALRNLGLPHTKEGVHTLRRSAARARFDQLAEDGYDGALRQVQALLHHSASTTTEAYLGLDMDVHHRNDQIRGRRMYRAYSVPRLKAVT